MPGGNKKVTHTKKSLVCVTFLLPPSIKGLKLKTIIVVISNTSKITFEHMSKQR